jgi:hypothetical protein
MVSLDVGLGYCGSWKIRSAGSGLATATAPFVDGRGSRLGADRTLLGAAGTSAASGSRSWCRRRGGRARPGGQFVDSGEVDAEQLWTLLKGGRDRPAQVQVVPGSHRSSLSNIGTT